ncbi:MAG: tRNA lysidine(34) synthetase TilS [Nevskiales bacterium]
MAHTDQKLIQHLQQWQAQCCPPEAKRYLVAFSGGLDSSVLLHALKVVADRPILAVYVDHGLHADSRQWLLHCQQQCAKLQLGFQALSVNVLRQGESLEAAAREARYAALQGLMQASDALLTAHHERDQAETLLLQLMRGAGIAGLAAMPAATEFGPGWLLRPLLELPKSALEQYAQAAALAWLDDPSNADTSLDRNYLRNAVLPELRGRWPALDTVLARSARHHAEAESLLADLAQTDLAKSQTPAGQLSIQALLELSPVRRFHALRQWIRAQGCPPPSTAQLQRLATDLLVNREDAQPAFVLPAYEIRRYRDLLYFLKPLAAAPTDVVLNWNVVNRLELPPDCGWLSAVPAQAGAIGLKPGQFQVRFAQGGERIKPLGSPHHKRLKHLFQSQGVPPWVRMRTPLIYHGQELVAVADAWLNADYLHNNTDMAWRPQWSGGPPGWPIRSSAA